MRKEIKGTRQHIKGNTQKEIDSNQQKKVNRTKLKNEVLSNDMTLENRENKDKPEQPSEKQKRYKEKNQEMKKDKNTLRDFSTKTLEG